MINSWASEVTGFELDNGGSISGRSKDFYLRYRIQTDSVSNQPPMEYELGASFQG
jgi:hypothetical protein